MTCLQPHLDVLKQDGCHARVLECIIAQLEPMDVCYLRDYSALEGPKGTGGVCWELLDEYED